MPVIDINSKKNKEDVFKNLKKEIEENGVVDFDNIKDLKSISDEELKKYIDSITNVVDGDNRLFLFASEEEAYIYAAALQNNIPEIRYVEIVKCFSIRTSQPFYTIKPMSSPKIINSEVSETEDLDNYTNDLAFISPKILMTINEYFKRRYEKVHQKDKEEVKKENR